MDQVEKNQKQSYEDKKEKRRQYNKQYYEDNKELILQREKKYREDNKELLLQRERKYRKDNWDKINKKINCDCGGRYTMKHKAHHFKSIKHKNWLLKQN